MSKTPYSYHTFIFPFVWEGGGENSVTLKKFKACFDSNPNWVDTNIKNESFMNTSGDVNTLDESLLFYKEFQYFHPHVRRAIYGFDSDIVANYSFKPEAIRNKGHYYIKKRDTEYDLLLNGIKLKIFNTGIALFIIESENHGLTRDGKPQDTQEAVKNINDFGRRISLPLISPGTGISLCAERLTLSIDGVADFTEDYSGFIESVKSVADFENRVSLTHICDFIKDILCFGGEYSITSHPSKNKKAFYIYPALDDRMFVASYIIDPKTVSELTRKNSEGEPAYLYDKEMSKNMYELVFVDPNGECCCQDHKLRRKELENHIYTRWLDLGTVTAYTNQALITLTSSGASYLADNFLTQYVQMCSIYLAQRASIINFQRQTSEVSSHIEDRGRQIRLTTVSKVMTLQERFVAFQNQLNFTEVTPQQQGMEIYDKLVEAGFVEKEKESLQNQLDALSDAANTSLDFNFNKYALIFAIPTLFFEFVGYLLEGSGNTMSICSLLAIAGGSLLIALVLFAKYRRRK